jgi:hypothetical protein
MTEHSAFSLKRNPQPQMSRSGFYLATIEMMDILPSNFGTPMLVTRWRLVGSPREGTPYTYLWRVPLTAEDIHKLAQMNRALELPKPSLPHLKSGAHKLDADDYLGKPALVFLKAEWYKGTRRSIITEIRSQTQAIAMMAILKGDPIEEPTL